MTRQEFFDKIEKVRQMVDGIGDSYNIGLADDIIILLDEVKDDVNQLLDDEYDAAFSLGVNRGWNHEGMDCE